MRAVVQRVKKAHVDVEGETVGKIDKGILVLLGVGQNDDEKDIEWLADKILNLRIFEDNEGKMNLSLLDIKGEILIVSQFTLYGDCRKGRRPSYSSAAKPDKGKEYYEKFIEFIENKYKINVEKGVFQAEMEVNLINDGPVTLLLDSEKTF
ncbi:MULTISPECIES: D-aminoacyl-tRNA deacylase [unclassified Marinitoga]|uniref:D-aminoacyl-tRNA deacylase n=1 Tax=unclassified Marinitoga TaxID=2640159 RepID=UPI000641267C|nr:MULTISPECIES: D-aminoacyl-tRNA deacylase [unclassified Marinitoga]KLO21746.1 D-tyrosyl-tRNA(Tyr) deacylase [Marinitoga sp. 1155]NUV00330.1 D-tyrosyl-tRNA(Tyr) deacylase [Marinitoga sp. 1154]